MELNSELDRLRKYTPIEAELNRAKKLHPNYPDDDFIRVAIINEEAGEITKAVLHFYYENGTAADIRKELIQTAAMCMRMIETISP